MLIIALVREAEAACRERSPVGGNAGSIIAAHCPDKQATKEIE
jgi:hypothetical protein